MPPAVPRATYRVQLTKAFGFDDAAALVPYLSALGISHLYASPFLKARSGTQHGYDIVDYNAINPEFGGEEGLARLNAALKAADMGLILDFVPNHMAIGKDNAWWFDVLEWGRRSPHAASFDIAWELLPYRPGGGLLLPVLGRPYADALGSGEIKLKFDAAGGSFSAWYFDHQFPINPQRYSDILRTVVGAADAAGDPTAERLLALADEYGRPGSPSYAQAPTLKRRLASIEYANALITAGLGAYGAERESGVAALHRLLERQHYRLAYWRLAASIINYRRFFDINELAGLRMEHPPTFRDSHRLVAQLIATDRLQGLRLDHIDGLFDPLQYARRLQQLVRQVRRGRPTPFYVVVEKILEPGERLPPLAGIGGTTGYEWLNVIARLLLYEPGRRILAAQWRELDTRQGDFAAVLESSKRHVLDILMRSEFNVLAELLARIAAGHYSTRDYAPDRLRDALRLYVLAFPIYRTYVTPTRCDDADRAMIGQAIAAARRRWVGTDSEIFDFVRDAVTLDLARAGLPYSRTRLRQFALKLQQFTGPMMAKSLEDTALYRYHSLLALNEVGSDPSLPALSVSEFHDRICGTPRRFRHGLIATTTHDTKRGEDARLRILSLSDIAELWNEHVAEWRQLNEPFVERSNGRRIPSASHQYMLYQALIGAWLDGFPTPDFVKRIEDYAVKAAREGKIETSWIDPDERYESGLRSFARSVLDCTRSAKFLESFDRFARRTALLGALNSLSQLVLKSTIPGVPDFYQGTEFWDLSLVDPDNRSPIDFGARQDVLRGPDAAWNELIAGWRHGTIKAQLTNRLLLLRSSMAELFRDGEYIPVHVDGPDARHVVSFMRSSRRQRLLVAVGRHYADVTSQGQHWPKIDWRARLQLDRKIWNEMRDALGGRATNELDLEIGALFRTMPFAVLQSDR